MSTRKSRNIKRHQRFFLINLSHDNLVNYYKINFRLLYTYKMSLTELENMLPWEREVYLTLLEQELKAEKEARQQQNR